MRRSIFRVIITALASVGFIGMSAKADEPLSAGRSWCLCSAHAHTHGHAGPRPPPQLTAAAGKRVSKPGAASRRLQQPEFGLAKRRRAKPVLQCDLRRSRRTSAAPDKTARSG